MSDLEFIYVGDPMCSWGWGFSPVLDRLHRRFDLPLRVGVGGLRPEAAAEPLEDRLRVFLRREWGKIADRTGQPFDPSVLEREDWIYDTMVADTAVVTMRELAAESTLPFFARVQRAFYAEGVDVTDPEVYRTLVDGFPVEPEEFVTALRGTGMAERTRQDFAEARAMGVAGFPTLLLRDGETGYVVSRGYAPYDLLEAGIRRFLAEHHPAEATGLVCEIGDVC